MTQAGDDASELGRLRADNLRLVEIIARYETRYQTAADEIERLEARVADLEDQLLQALGERPMRREGI
jgi:cell division protein FtsB